MKNIITIIVFICNLNTYAQINANLTSDDFFGTWEWVDGNQIFRINLFNGTTYNGSATIRGHFTMVEVDSSGNETLLYTSDRPYTELVGSPNWMPVINGGRYLDYIDSYRFGLFDNTTNYLLLGVLDLKFLDTTVNEPLQISWTLRVDGMSNEDEVFNVPTDITLTKVN